MNYRQLIGYSKELFSDLKQSIGEFLPHIVGAIIILFIGHFIARLFSAMTTRFLIKLSQLIPAKKNQVHVKSPKIVRSSDLIGKIIALQHPSLH